jgi:pimeloyl-ACP methyl ester carboxylesterase
VIETIYNDLWQKDYTVVTWSQERPAGPIDVSISELNEGVKIANKLTKAGIIIIGQSRGGLIGRRYLMRRDKSIRGLITISSPHRGSSMAKLSNYLSPLASLISPLFSSAEKGTLSSTIKHILDFLKSKALRELLPDSPFLKSLKDEPLDWVYYVSVGGTEPTLLTLYRLRWDPVREGELQRWFLKADELFSIPDIFNRVIPQNLYPEEIKKGKGDGLVSAESSQLPWCNEHYNFGLNHAQMLFDKGVRDLLVKEIERIS